MTLVDLLKQLLWIILFLIIAPTALLLLRRQYAPFFEAKTAIAIISIQGPLNNSAWYIHHLTRFFTDPDIKGILLKIDTTTPADGTAETIYNEIQTLKRTYPKPVVGLIESNGTRGGYWIACAADYLVAPGTALIGNIGPFKSSEPTELPASVAEDIYQQFMQVVARARKLSLSKGEQWAQDKIFTGNQAAKLHLIDEVGSLHTTLEILKQKALIEGEIEWKHPLGSHEWFAAVL
jgi:protease-4